MHLLNTVRNCTEIKCKVTHLQELEKGTLAMGQQSKKEGTLSLWL